MTVREIAELFMRTDPKQKIIINKGNYEMYEGRIEFLFNCDNPLEEEIVNTAVITENELHPPVLEIRIK